MKNKFLNIALAFIFLGLASCNDILEEEPKSLLTAKFLESPEGVRSALYSAYSDLRYFYGGEGGLSVTCAGTDEWQRGPDGNRIINEYGSGLRDEGLLANTWDWGYTGINTANAVIKYAAGSGMTESEYKRLIAEAKYIRATWYFILVQTYGALPLSLDFISKPSTVAVRNPVGEVYAAIIDDLEKAKLDLPNRASQAGRVTAAAAYHLLAKVYLTRATNLEARVSTDYQMAYDNAMQLVNNKGLYGLELLKNFFDVHYPRNESSSEIIFTVQRNTDPIYNDLDPNRNGNKNNRSSFFFRPNYNVIAGGLVRSTGFYYGRPWHRVRPTNFLLNKVFEERVDDTRYNNTFQTTWIINDAATIGNSAFAVGDTAIWLPGTENFNRNMKALRIFPPSQYFGNGGQTLSIFPSLNKYNDIDRPTVADASVRPFIVHRFAETYLIAAEAAMYLNNAAESRRLLNIVRARAAFSPSRTDGQNALAVSRIEARTPSMTDKIQGINFILDERSRELAGEYMRWWDLVRTRTSDDPNHVMLLQRLRDTQWDFQGKNIQNFHVLRPIPKSQTDFTTVLFPNNPGYN